MDKIPDLTEKFKRNHADAKVKYAAFTFPIVGDDLYLAQRRTPPMVGLYSAIGGKVDSLEDGMPTIRWPISSDSEYVMDKGYERLKWTGLKELLEEIYLAGDKLVPKKGIVVDLDGFEIGDSSTFFDANTGVTCYTKIIRLPEQFSVGDVVINSRRFNPSKRETGNIRTVSEINVNDINPLTKVALHIIKNNRPNMSGSLDGKFGFIENIPNIKMNDSCGDFHGWTGEGFRYHFDFREGKGCYFDYDVPNS